MAKAKAPKNKSASPARNKGGGGKGRQRETRTVTASADKSKAEARPVKEDRPFTQQRQGVRVHHDRPLQPDESRAQAERIEKENAERAGVHSRPDEGEPISSVERRKRRGG